MLRCFVIWPNDDSKFFLVLEAFPFMKKGSNIDFGYATFKCFSFIVDVIHFG